MSVTAELERWSQEVQEFKTSLSYISNYMISWSMWDSVSKNRKAKERKLTMIHTAFLSYSLYFCVHLQVILLLYYKALKWKQQILFLYTYQIISICLSKWIPWHNLEFWNAMERSYICGLELLSDFDCVKFFHS